MKPIKVKTQLTLRLPQKLNELLQKMANDKGISKNSLILSKLWELAK